MDDATLPLEPPEVLLTATVPLTSSSSGSADSGDPFNVGVWDPQSGAQLRTFKGASSQRGTLDVVADAFLVSACPGKPVLNAWKITRREQVTPKITLPGAASALCCSPSGHHLAAATGRDIYLWSSSSGVLLRHLRGCHFQPVTRLAFSADGLVLLSASQDGGVYAWSLPKLASLTESAEPAPIRKWHAHELAVTDLAAVGATGASTRVFSSSADRTVKAHCLASDRLLLDVQVGQPVRSLAVDGSESVLCAGTEGGQILLFPLLDPPRNVQATQSEMRPSTLRGHAGPVTCLSVSADGHLLASGAEGDGGRVLLWRLDPAGGDQSDPLRVVAHRGGSVAAARFVLPPLGLTHPDAAAAAASKVAGSVCLATTLQKVEVSRGAGRGEEPTVTPFLTQQRVQLDFFPDEFDEEVSDDSVRETIGDSQSVVGAVASHEEQKRLEKANMSLYRILKKISWNQMDK